MYRFCICCVVTVCSAYSRSEDVCTVLMWWIWLLNNVFTSGVHMNIEQVALLLQHVGTQFVLLTSTVCHVALPVQHVTDQLLQSLPPSIVFLQLYPKPAVCIFSRSVFRMFAGFRCALWLWRILVNTSVNDLVMVVMSCDLHRAANVWSS